PPRAARLHVLVDKSVWARARRAPVAAVLSPLVEAGLVATCWMIDLEILYSVRTGGEHDEIRAERRGLEWLPMPDEVGDRAIEVQNELARRGRHRGVPLPDLVIAATAERHGATVLHYDADFDLIAEVTGQPVQWVVPRGTAD
ncbi:MAG: PIN domain nuclease, partial [Pseudonocardiales bacterium]|nr:PIN domain nuclease [Pseudonocardiales bacterium]